MNEAAKLLLDHEDFQCFSKVHTDVNHFNCKIKEAYWEQNDHQLLFHITANRFLRGMVRAIVGTLVQVGLGRLDCGQFQEILDSKDRSQAKSASPARTFAANSANIVRARSSLTIIEGLIKICRDFTSLISATFSPRISNMVRI